MATNWKRSGLYPGQKVKISRDLLVDPNEGGKRFIKAEYVTEAPAGIIIELYFQPGITEEPDKKHYRKFINWASIYCGDVHIQLSDGSEVRAVKLNTPAV